VKFEGQIIDAEVDRAMTTVLRFNATKMVDVFGETWFLDRVVVVDFFSASGEEFPATVNFFGYDVDPEETIITSWAWIFEPSREYENLDEQMIEKARYNY
jgi:hypothetical protein